MTPEQQKQMLLSRVKADNAIIAEHEKQLSEAQAAIRDGKKQLAQLKNDQAEANDPKAQKYQELFQRDKEMSELIDSFEPTRKAETEKIQAAQDEVVQLLQAISRKLALDPDNMSRAKLDEMQEDLDFKQAQMDHSVSTSERLQRELTQRKLELDKIESLDEKISVELNQLQEKLTSMDSELDVFENIRRCARTPSGKRRSCLPKRLTRRRAWGSSSRRPPTPRSDTTSSRSRTRTTRSRLPSRSWSRRCATTSRQCTCLPSTSRPRAPSHTLRASPRTASR